MLKKFQRAWKLLVGVHLKCKLLFTSCREKEDDEMGLLGGNFTLLIQHGSGVYCDLKPVAALFYVALAFLLLVNLLKLSPVGEMFFFFSEALICENLLFNNITSVLSRCLLKSTGRALFLQPLGECFAVLRSPHCCIISCYRCLEYSRKQWYPYWDKFCRSCGLQIAARFKYIR